MSKCHGMIYSPPPCPFPRHNGRRDAHHKRRIKIVGGYFKSVVGLLRFAHLVRACHTPGSKETMCIPALVFLFLGWWAWGKNGLGTGWRGEDEKDKKARCPWREGKKKTGTDQTSSNLQPCSFSSSSDFNLTHQNIYNYYLLHPTCLPSPPLTLHQSCQQSLPTLRLLTRNMCRRSTRPTYRHHPVGMFFCVWPPLVLHLPENLTRGGERFLYLGSRTDIVNQ